MSTPVTPTEAHRTLADKFKNGFVTQYAIERFAELIAESEARYGAYCLERVNLAENESSKLRAEVDKLHEVNANFDSLVAEVADFKANGGSVLELVKLRAEVERLTGVKETLKHNWSVTNTRAEKAEATCAELVTDGNAITLAASLAQKSIQLAAEREKVRVLREALAYYADESRWDNEIEATEGGEHECKVYTPTKCTFSDDGNGDGWEKAKAALAATEQPKTEGGK